MKKLNLKGQYKIVINSANGIVKETDWFDNLITNTGLDFIGQEEDLVYYMRVGRGNTEPTFDDLNLDDVVTVAPGVLIESTSLGEPTFGTTKTHKYVFDYGSVIGEISELGTAPSEYSDLFSRALIKDNSGNPTTLNVLSSEQLTVYYRLIMIPDLTDTVGTVEIMGTTYDYLLRICDVTNFFILGEVYDMCAMSNPTAYNGPIQSVLGFEPTGLSSGGTSTSNAYYNGNYSCEYAYEFPKEAANFQEGITSVKIPFGYEVTSHCYQIEFSPAIPKTSAHVLTLNLNFSWGRA